MSVVGDGWLERLLVEELAGWDEAFRTLFVADAGLGWTLEDPVEPLRLDERGLWFRLSGWPEPVRLWDRGGRSGDLEGLLGEGWLAAFASDFRAVVATLSPEARTRVRPDDLFEPGLLRRLCRTPAPLRPALLAGPSRLGRHAHTDWEPAFRPSGPLTAAELETALGRSFPVCTPAAELAVGGPVELDAGEAWARAELRVFDQDGALRDLRPQRVPLVPVAALAHGARVAGYLRALAAWLSEHLLVEAELELVLPWDLVVRGVIERSELDTIAALVDALREPPAEDD